MAKDITYQNKDILFKILSEQYKNKSFSAYGIDIPPIKAMLPTNLPPITANEKSMDNLFLLEDGTYAIIDYEDEAGYPAVDGFGRRRKTQNARIDSNLCQTTPIKATELYSLQRNHSKR